MIDKLKPLAAAIAVSIGYLVSFSCEAETVENLTVLKETQEKSVAKQTLMSTLAQMNNLSASFKQDVKDTSDELIQQGEGKFVIAKPNLMVWQTFLPDESTITSDGETIWLFDPFIEQVTAYSLAQSVKNTPILLLTTTDESLWDNYLVEGNLENGFHISSQDQDAQIKTLSLAFSGNVLTSFSFEDVTGQKSYFSLADIQMNQTLPNGLFSFEVPEGILLDDQR
ncbi:outer membrane lipoprotein chaperone LolA [Thalassotalea euphylliae]|uniref:outer membrane lipoprotein chaperone LolA n=1 Tax=Thalassotalea euphylliae TaxID=1655234 RepID=UPI00363447A1